MTTITKERIELFIKNPLENGLTRGEQMELARIVMASLEAEPIGAFHIADQQVGGTSDYIKDGEWPIDNGVIDVYAVPPVQETGVYNDVFNIIGLLKKNEWAEHCTSTVLGSLLESEITRLVGKEQPASVVPPAIEPDYEVIKSILPTANPDEYACTIAADMWNACRAAMLQGAEPVSQTYELPELIEGMEVSIDVSTCDADAGNRYFGTVTEVSELYTAKNGYILLVQDAKPNFDVNGNSPVTPDGWISCSERMPNDKDYVWCWGKSYGWTECDTFEGYYDWSRNKWWAVTDDVEEPASKVTHWMPLPEPPQEVK